MGRNVEIKAKVTELDQVRRLAEAMADERPSVSEQEDTFFRCRDGQLKLRVFSESQGELIFYRREDSAKPRESLYQIVPAADPSGLRTVLESALGVVGVVKKQRTLYTIGQTRVHLDVVEALGEFVEIEVVLQPEQSVEDGVRIAEDLMTALRVAPDNVVAGAYIDLLGTDT